MAALFKKGDLVCFDLTHQYGLVLEAKAFDGFEEWKDEPFIQDVLVRWIDGKEFWCLSFTLKPVN